MNTEEELCKQQQEFHQPFKIINLWKISFINGEATVQLEEEANY